MRDISIQEILNCKIKFIGHACQLIEGRQSALSKTLRCAGNRTFVCVAEAFSRFARDIALALARGRQKANSNGSPKKEEYGTPKKRFISRRISSCGPPPILVPQFFAGVTFLLETLPGTGSASGAPTRFGRSTCQTAWPSGGAHHTSRGPWWQTSPSSGDKIRNPTSRLKRLPGPLFAVFFWGGPFVFH